MLAECVVVNLAVTMIPLSAAMAVSSMTNEDVMSGAAGRRLPHPLALAWFLVLAALLLTAGYVAVFGHPSDGGPVARLAIAVAPAGPDHATAETAQTGRAVAEHSSPSSVEDLLNSGVSAPDAKPIAGQSAEPKLPPRALPPQIVKPVYAGKALVADPALIEATPEGPLPRIADDGRTPMTAYAPAVSAVTLKGKKKIALVITGLGISAKATAAALDGLPPAVTLAFAPYAQDVQRWVSEARKRGHEVLLEVPMEPYDFPDSDPGPHTLRPRLSEAGNIQRLKWALTRFTGYAGITNLLGGHFLANADAVGPIMTTLARRGLLFYDDGEVSHSVARQSAAQSQAAFVRSAVDIDRIESGMEIDQRLSELETRARTDGVAAGTGFLYPVTVGRVANWAKGLEGRGFVLVPASAIVAPDK